jgi:hypothetical protein
VVAPVGTGMPARLSSRPPPGPEQAVLCLHTAGSPPAGPDPRNLGPVAAAA